jgi:hypothetical protein
MAITKPGLGGRPLTGGKFTTAKRSTGAPAPRLALGSNVTVPSTSAPLSAAVPFRTSGNLPNQIRLAGADWEILGRGVFDERLNGAGDGVSLSFLLVYMSVLMTTSTASCAAMVVKSSSALSSRPVRLVSASHASTVLPLRFRPYPSAVLSVISTAKYIGARAPRKPTSSSLSHMRFVADPIYS